MISLAWLVAAAAAPAAQAPQQWQAVTSVQVVARGEPMPERRVDRRSAFYTQDLLTEAARPARR